MKAMIFAAGMGTRLKPFTDNHPKALAQVNGVPLLKEISSIFRVMGLMILSLIFTISESDFSFFS
jgi:CTP:phosphocholine cytidylyltransferase-like protein